MSSIKVSRTAEDIKLQLMQMFYELKDPRVSKMLSIIKLDLSNDVSHCKVYVSAIEGKEKTLQSIEGLKSAAGYIRHELSARLKLRKVPEFHFIADDSIEHSANINTILKREHEKYDVNDSDVNNVSEVADDKDGGTDI